MLVSSRGHHLSKLLIVGHHQIVRERARIHKLISTCILFIALKCGGICHRELMSMLRWQLWPLSVIQRLWLLPRFLHGLFSILLPIFGHVWVVCTLDEAFLFKSLFLTVSLQFVSHFIQQIVSQILKPNLNFGSFIPGRFLGNLLLLLFPLLGPITVDLRGFTISAKCF